MTNLTKTQQQQVQKEVSKRLRLLSTSRQTAVLFGSEFKRHLTTALIAAFGLVIALSWQTVIKKFVENIPKSGILIYHPTSQMFTLHSP